MTKAEDRKKLLESISSEDREAFGIPTESESESLHEALGITDEVEEAVKPKKKAPAKRAPAKKKKITPDVDMLAGVVIDLNNIEFTERSPLEQLDDIDFILNGKPTFQIVANQSAYIAHMESIRLQDINALTNSSTDRYATKNKLYKTIWSKINTTSVGKIDYKTWLKVTSFYDLSSLMYGVYCQTFPGDTTFEVRCRHCEQPTDVIVNNNTLISVKDEATYSKLNEIINNIKKPEELLGQSLVNKFNRTVFPMSKIIMDIQTPSLHDHLELLASTASTPDDQLEEFITTLMFIKNVFILDMAELAKTGKPKYYPVDDKNKIIQLLRGLEINDAQHLGNIVSERSEKYAIEYKIKDFDCSKCGKSVGEIPVDVEQLLFTQILRM